MQELNNAQKRAVSHYEGPCLVLAGPGSGKTRVITERIRFLIHEEKVPASSVLVITFTKAAAIQMKERYQRLCGGDSGGVHFGTFHAIFFMILRQEFHYSVKNVIYGENRRELLRQITRRIDLEIQDENEFLNDLESEISRIKGNQLDFREYHSAICDAQTFGEIFEQYEQTIKKRKLLDFDDMLLSCYHLLSKRQDILEVWQKQFSFILIDEFQDICLVQYKIIQMLAAPERNLFIVGDDDQSIYGFRGARPDIMKQFLEDYPDAKQYLLNVNYRSISPITDMSGKVILHNKNRFSKKILSAEEKLFSENAENGVMINKNPEKTELWIGSGTEEIFSVQKFQGASEENTSICETITKYLQQGIPCHEIAVLFRTNAQARSLGMKLAEYRIPFLLKERVSSLYDHWIVQDIFAYVRIAQGDRERGNVLRIINRPKRYIHHNAFTESYADFEELKLFYEEKDWMVERIEELEYQLKMLAKMKPYAAVHFIRKGIGYDDFIREYALSHRSSEEAMMEVLDELLEEAGDFETFEAWLEHIREYKKTLDEQIEKKKNETEDAVSLLTMHGAKGLEYTCVFIPDANEGVTPHGKSVLDRDIEEERRLFYVAMTRAKEHLHISYVEERFHKTVEPSRFVQEILN